MKICICIERLWLSFFFVSVVSVRDANYGGFIALIVILVMIVSVLVIGGCLLYHKMKDGDRTL